MFRAIADVLRAVGSTLAAVVTLPFRALARLFGGASGSARRPRRTGARRPRRM
ncbi:LPFR motif small protein, partial [Streptomyces sp. NPDC026294]